MNEFDFIKQVRERVAAQRHDASLIQGIGDDAAIVRLPTGRDCVVTTDLLVEDIDFRRSFTLPQLLGHKALAVSLSDIAAMGARPRWALLSIGIPADVWESDFASRLYAGYLKLADHYGVKVIGGDVSRTPEKIVLDSIVMGESVAGRPILRRGAQAGDQIFVTGCLGDAAAGLRLLERGARIEVTDKPERVDENSIDGLLLRQLRPEPRVGWGLALCAEQLASAMIDISDGLSSDLNHLCEESGVGAVIDATSIPIDNVVREICGRRALDPLMLALHGGEDYELLFTARPQVINKLPHRVDGVPVTQIGTIKDSSYGVKISEGAREWELKPGGWEHFS